MSNPKVIPELPAILPSGDLDCDTDPSGAVFEELREFSIGSPEVLAERRHRARTQREAEESAVAVTRAAEEARRGFSKKPKRQVSTPVRLEEFGELIRKAALASGADVAEFCALLDLDDVPTPGDWPEKRWRIAYENRERWSAIRGVKLRALRSRS